MCALPDRWLEEEPLASRTTLEVGGPARYLVPCGDGRELTEALDEAQQRSLEVLVLGGGSNLLVSDEGFDGLVVQLTSRRLEFEDLGEVVRVRAEGGLDWDDFVAQVVAEGLGGVECLSGIPGSVGAAPIQNIGAYGQEVSETLRAVEVVDRTSGQRRWIDASDCGLAYRWSHFKGPWSGRYVVTRVEFDLPRTAEGTVRYADLRRVFGLREGGSTPSPAVVREAVLEVRRSKSMVLDPTDPNRRSAGSFFVNPVVSEETAAGVRGRWQALGGDGEVPTYPAPDGVKMPAAWLIERSGFERGYRLGPAGLSSRHTLALINRGEAKAADLLRLASQVRAGVRETFGVVLRPEPVFVGFSRSVDELLDGAVP